MTLSTRTHGRCGVDECGNPGRGALIQSEAGRWHLVNGFTYSKERRTFVLHSWAESCDNHQDLVTQAVRHDTDGWPDRWRVQVRTLDYSDADRSGERQAAHGIGTPAVDGRLF